MQGSVFDRVKSLIQRIAPALICDDCITERLNLSLRQHANQKTRELAGSSGFERQLSSCDFCGATKKVIGRKTARGL